MIDEKEIEILEKDATIKIFKEELQKSRELAAAQETKSAEWNDKLEQHCKETEDWKVKLEKAEVALEKASEESKEVARQLRYERDTLQGKLEEYESIFSEEQLKELYHSMEEKDKRISELERELSDTSKKDHRISEMEMELEVLQSEVSSWKRTTEEAQISLQDSKDIIKEQEERIVELESSKSSAAVKDVEKAGMELQDLRQELEAAKLRLEDLENEKNSGQKLLQEKNQYLEECDHVIDMLKEDLDEKFEELKETSARLQESLQETKEKEAQAIKAAEELKTTKTELGDIQKAHQTISNEYDCAMKQVRRHNFLSRCTRQFSAENVIIHFCRNLAKFLLTSQSV